jgi:hypothetical protein
MYNKGYAIKIVRNMIQDTMSKANTQASSIFATEVWLTAWKVMQSLLLLSLYYTMSLQIVPAQADWECKPE